MDGVALLAEARAAGLTVSTADDRLIIEGPRAAGHVAARLITAKTIVFPLLAGKPGRGREEPVYRPLDGTIAADIAAKHTQEAITARLERLETALARSHNTPLSQAVLDDWRAILATKETGL